MKKKQVIGGQAVIEGVMMRSPNHYAIAIRKPDEKISVKVTRHVAYAKRKKIYGFFFVRGVVNLIEALVLGMKGIMYSANESGESDEHMSSKELIFTLALSIIIALAVFKFLPLLLANILTKSLGLNNFWFNIADGVIKISIFIIYIWGLSFMKDMKRLFAYHGAEHMTVHCYEKDKKLNVKNAKNFKTMHPRCGTEFLLLVLIVSIILYMFIPFGASFWTKYILRILLLPIIAGISYEILKIAGLNQDIWLAKIVAAPGMLLQRLTTEVPDKDQLEVAIASLKAVLKAEAKNHS